MQVGLVGLSQAGKTTLFQLLSGGVAATPNKANRAMVRIPDHRIDFLAEVYKPKKTTYASLEVVDIPGLVPGTDKSATAFLSAVRESDLLVHVIQAFSNPQVPNWQGNINPLRDLELVSYELLLADLDLVEKRIQRIQEGKQKKEHQLEMALLEKVQATLEKERLVTSMVFSKEEELLLRNYQLLTDKPYLVVINVDETAIISQEFPGCQEVKKYCEEREIPLQVISVKTEFEISELEGEDRELFLQELGIAEPGVMVLTRLIYEKLNLISFFTVGEDEVKAWTIEKGTVARKAAGKIHSDIEKGFIRAEVIDYSSFQQAKGSMAAAREAGTLRLEGRDYVVNDGDIMHVRFNI